MIPCIAPRLLLRFQVVFQTGTFFSNKGEDDNSETANSGHFELCFKKAKQWMHLIRSDWTSLKRPNGQVAAYWSEKNQHIFGKYYPSVSIQTIPRVTPVKFNPKAAEFEDYTTSKEVLPACVHPFFSV